MNVNRYITPLHKTTTCILYVCHVHRFIQSSTQSQSWGSDDVNDRSKLRAISKIVSQTVNTLYW